MALSPELEKLLALMQDPTEREATRLRLIENEEKGLRQADYDRKMNESKAETARIQAELAQQVTTNQEWFRKNKKIFDDQSNALDQAERERDELKQKVEAAVTAGNGNGAGVDQAQLKAMVEAQFAGRKFVSSSELAAAVQKTASELLEQERQRFFKETLPASTNFTLAMMNLNFAHRDEFGEPLNQEAFGKYMTDNKLAVNTGDDLKRAHDAFVSQRRVEKKIATATEEARKDERTKLTVPGTGSAPSSAPELGHLQQRLQKTGMPEVVLDDSVKPGSGQLAAAAAAELRAEGKF